MIGLCVSLGTMVPSTNKTDCHYIHCNRKKISIIRLVNNANLVSIIKTIRYDSITSASHENMP